MAHCVEGIAEQADLVLGRGGSGHAVGRGLVLVVVAALPLCPSPVVSCDSGLPVQEYRQGGAAASLPG